MPARARHPPTPCPASALAGPWPGRVQVILYDGLTRAVKRTFSRFKDVAYSGCMRHDGRLMVAGGQTGIVQVCCAAVVPHQCPRLDHVVPGAVLHATYTHTHTHARHVPRCAWPSRPPARRISKVFDAGSRSVLRQLKGHARPVHVARFAPDKVHVLSGGDDVTLRWWDIASGKQLLRLVGHEDYVRAAAVSPSSRDTWASGARSHMCVCVRVLG